MKQTLAERAANMTPMSVEQLVTYAKFARDWANADMQRLCESHEALRAQLHREREATAAMLMKVSAIASEMDEYRQMSPADHARITDRLQRILRGQA